MWLQTHELSRLPTHALCRSYQAHHEMNSQRPKDNPVGLTEKGTLTNGKQMGQMTAVELIAAIFVAIAVSIGGTSEITTSRALSRKHMTLM